VGGIWVYNKEWRKLHKEVLHHVYSSPNTTWVLSNAEELDGWVIEHILGRGRGHAVAIIEVSTI
jgi:hypothetical protein